MPVKDTDKKLWQETEQERNDYDDMMMANIELKSSDFESNNFTVLFMRPNEESLPTMSEKHKTDLIKYQQLVNPDPDSKWRKYGQKYTNTTNWREKSLQWTRPLGWGCAYLVFRELPIRNFYARCLLMAFFVQNYYLHRVMPDFMMGMGGNTVTRDDAWQAKKRHNIELVRKAATEFSAPREDNRLPQALQWKVQQPGHIHLDMVPNMKNFGFLFSSPRPVHWDGTFNMPLLGLTDKHHKDSAGVKFV